MKMVDVQCPFCKKHDQIPVGLQISIGNTQWLHCSNEECNKPFLVLFTEDGIYSKELNDSFMRSATPKDRIPYLFRKLLELLVDLGYYQEGEWSHAQEVEDYDDDGERDSEIAEEDDSSNECLCPKCQEEITPPMRQPFIEALFRGVSFCHADLLSRLRNTDRGIF